MQEMRSADRGYIRAEQMYPREGDPPFRMYLRH